MPKSWSHSREVPFADAGTRLDRWLAAQLPELSRSRIQKLIQQGLVAVDGRIRPASMKLPAHATVAWTVPAPEPSHLEADPTVGLSILYEDEDLAVVDKPAGLVVHPAPGHAEGTLIHGLLARLDTMSEVGGKRRPGLVHRLDKDTSGLVVVAKNDAAHLHLQRQLRDRTLGRVYRALCWGVPDSPRGVIDLPLGRHPRDRKRFAVRPGGRRAVTHYEVDEAFAGASSLRVRLETGRTHQIRVHLAHVGHPVLGDALYGGGEKRLRGAAPEHRAALRAALTVLSRQALHAWRLRLVHPGTGEEMEFESAVPSDFGRALDLLAAPSPS